MAIQNLTAATQVTTSDFIAIFSQQMGCDAKASMSVFLTWLETQFPTTGLVTQYASPNATGFVVNVSAAGDGAGQSVWLLITPLAGYASGAILLPPVAICFDQQELEVTCTQAVTALTVSGNGAVVNGAPTTLAANGIFKLRFDAVNQSWYRAP